MINRVRNNFSPAPGTLNAIGKGASAAKSITPSLIYRLILLLPLQSRSSTNRKIQVKPFERSSRIPFSSVLLAGSEYRHLDTMIQSPSVDNPPFVFLSPSTGPQLTKIIIFIERNRIRPVHAVRPRFSSFHLFFRMFLRVNYRLRALN